MKIHHAMENFTEEFNLNANIRRMQRTQGIAGQTLSRKSSILAIDLTRAAKLQRFCLFESTAPCVLSYP